MARRFVPSSAVAICMLLGLTDAQALNSTPLGALDKAARVAIVQEAAKALKDGYVFPDVGERAAKAIETALDMGNYTALSEPQAFAERLTADLQAIAHDKHLRVFAPAGPGLGPSVAGSPAPRDEGGIVRADRLAGDIGYIDIIGFPRVALFRPPLDRAMAALAKTKALIIDARHHGGGTPDAEAYLVGYFLPKGAAPVTVDRMIFRNKGTDTLRTEDFQSSPTLFSYDGKPVYILTSNHTFSGGEALAYNMRALHLCRIVGETTGGGANPGGTVPIGSGFAMFLPQGRSNNPITGTNWEGVGVKPDIASPAADALKVALEHLGQKPLAPDIEALSQERLFTPRTTPQPGSEAAVRRMIGELQRGEPNYELRSEAVAKVTREQLPRLHSMFTQLGKIETVTFVEVGPGGDVYDVKLTNGSVRYSILLAPDGKTVNALVNPLPPK